MLRKVFSKLKYKVGQVLIPVKYREAMIKANKFDRIKKNPPVVKSRYAYEGDGIATRHNHDFIHDELFARAYEAASPYLLNPKMHWRTYTNCWAARRALTLPGDFVECGVYKGGFARAVTIYTDFLHVEGRQYYLFDTFKGLDDAISSKEELDREAKISRYEEDYYHVVDEAFQSYANVKLVRGTVPDTLKEVDIRQVAYLSIDMNNITAEKAALDYFWPKLTTSAVVVLDDYGWRGYEKQKQMHDSFGSSHGVEVLTLPTGQGLIIKN